MAFRAPAASSEVENSINRGKEKLIVLYEMLQNHCLPEGTSSYSVCPDKFVKFYIFFFYRNTWSVGFPS